MVFQTTRHHFTPSPVMPKVENLRSPVTVSGNTDEKHSAHNHDPLADRGAFEDSIAQLVAIGEISEYAVTIEGEEQTTS